MQDALPIVIVAVVVVAGLVGVATLLSSRGAYDQIGRGGMTFDHEAAGVDGMRPLIHFATRRSARCSRRPTPAGPPRPRRRWTLADARAARRDDGLRAEVRAFVESRNARRVARGQPPLDVEAEVERRLSGQDG